jgi:DNA-binding MarR family transcriptional regulator
VQAQDRLWSDFSFVASSAYREKVILALASGPKLPHQIAKDTDLRLSHVSRALRELAARELIECLTPGAKGPGRLYAITGIGADLMAYREAASRRFAPVPKDPQMIGFVPKIRGASLVRAISFLRGSKGKAAVHDALKDWSVNPDALTEDMWVSAEAYDEFLELLESKFGDGAYGFIRTLYRQVMPGVSTVREHLPKTVQRAPLPELAPIVYAKEWNYGRLVVRRGPRQATFSHFDWMPTPSFCAMFHGTYEGILRARTAEGTVTKTRCIRAGDDRCEYVAAW